MHPDDPCNATRFQEIERRLTGEFPSIPPAEIKACVSRVAGELLDGARLLDFVPLLAERFAREQLHSRASSVRPIAA